MNFKKLMLSVGLSAMALLAMPGSTLTSPVSVQAAAMSTSWKPTSPNSQPVQPQGPRSVNARHAERSQIRSNFPKLPIP